MTLRYFHPLPEHKAQAVAKLGERFQASEVAVQSQSEIVTDELKPATEDVFASKLGQNQNVFYCEEDEGWES